MKIYIAYGSNMDTEQMAYRCPDAICIGTAMLKDWRLMFKSCFATIEREKGYNTPVTLWNISKKDEKNLDRYEGYPDFYYKTDIVFDDLHVFQEYKNFADMANKGMVYIMYESHAFRLPSMQYYGNLYYSYIKYHFATKILTDAVTYSKENSTFYNDTMVYY